MDSATAAAASTIKGSFVAVPIHGGTPPPVVTIAWKRAGDDARRIAITVSVRSAIGEPLIGREVQFNLDKGLARRLNELWSKEGDAKKVLENTKLTYGVQPTKGNGEAENTPDYRGRSARAQGASRDRRDGHHEDHDLYTGLGEEWVSPGAR